MGSTLTRSKGLTSCAFPLPFFSHFLHESPLLSSLWNTSDWRGTPVCTILRHRSSHIKIANRKKVEMFIGQRFHVPTRLRNAAPDIAAEWDFDKNPGHLYPAIVGVGCMQPVWWKCQCCGFSFCMSPEKRVVRGGRCPNCQLLDKREDPLLHQNVQESVPREANSKSGMKECSDSSLRSSDAVCIEGVLPLLTTEKKAEEIILKDTEENEDGEVIREYLLGEKDASFRVKRPPMLTTRTKY